MRLFYVSVLLIISVGSCTLQQRRYSHSWHIEWKKKSSGSIHTPRVAKLAKTAGCISYKAYITQDIQQSDSPGPASPAAINADSARQSDVYSYYNSLKSRRRNLIGSSLASAGGGISGAAALVLGIVNAMGAGATTMAGSTAILMLCLVLGFMGLVILALHLLRRGIRHEDEAWERLQTALKQLPSQKDQSDTVTEMVVFWLRETTYVRSGSLQRWIKTRRRLRLSLADYQVHFQPEQWQRIQSQFRKTLWVVIAPLALIPLGIAELLLFG